MQWIKEVEMVESVDDPKIFVFYHDDITMLTPGVCRDESHAQGYEIQRQNSEREQIRTQPGPTKRVNPR